MKKKPQQTRSAVLHAVIDEILTSQNGQIPTDIDGVDDFFEGLDDLIYSLLLCWHTHLLVSLDRGLADEPEDREDAVIEAWRHATWIYWGMRLIIDDLAANPPTEGVAHAIAVTARNDWASMAITAGLASSFDEPAVRIGHRLETKARERNLEQHSVGRDPSSTTFRNKWLRPRHLR